MRAAGEVFTNRILSVTFEETYSLFSKKTCKKEEFEGINEFIEIQTDRDFLLIVSSLVYKEFNPKKYVGNLFSDIKKKFTIEVNVEGKEPIKFRLDEREKMMTFFRTLKDY